MADTEDTENQHGQDPLEEAYNAPDAQDAVTAVEEAGGRAVAKAVVPGLLHKSEAGGVVLDVTPDRAAAVEVGADVGALLGMRNGVGVDPQPFRQRLGADLRGRGLRRQRLPARLGPLRRRLLAKGPRETRRGGRRARPWTWLLRRRGPRRRPP